MPYSESYWKRREEADEEREGAPSVESAHGAQVSAPEVVDEELWDNEIGDPVQSPGPAYGPVEPPPPVPPDVAPPPAPPPAAPEFADYAPSKPPPDDGMKAQRLKAIDNIRRMSEEPMQAPAGLGDADIAAASQRDRQRVRESNLSETIRAAFARDRPRLQQEPSEADALTSRRATADRQASTTLGRKLTAEERIAAALKEPKGGATGGLTEFQKYTIDRNASTEAAKKEAAEKKAAEAAAQLERDREMLQKDFPAYDLSKADEKTIQKLLSLRHAKATEAQAAASLAETKTQHVDAQAAKLAETLGDPAAFQQKYDRIMQLKQAAGGEIPGLGVVEGIRQQAGPIGSVARAVSPSSPEAIEGRKLMRQLASEYARSISGAGVSDKERAQLNAAALDVENDDSRIAQGGLDTLKDMYETKVALTKAGARPEAVKRIEGAAKPAPRPMPKPAPKRPPGLTEKAVFKNGKWYEPYPDGSGWDEIEVAE